ncbi:MAG: hypothetical protein ACAI35_26235 [Candidatus Methylacidiphilales bacterium]|nr:hypothetical protein [Candidatus Methylacidiphilales bacterium]
MALALRRREALSFSHHDEVVSAGVHDTPEQDNWLDDAIKNKWSPVELREVEGLALSLKREDIAELPSNTAESLREKTEPIARYYQELCALRG